MKTKYTDFPKQNIKIYNFSPETYDGIKYDLEKGKKELTTLYKEKVNKKEIIWDQDIQLRKQLIEIFGVSNDEDDLKLKELLNEEYGIKYVIDEEWIKIDCGNIEISITSHDVLDKLLYDPEQYEGISVIKEVNGFIFISCIVACGQGGGFMVINTTNGEIIFETREYCLSDLIYLREHDLFISINEMDTYAWSNYSIILLNKNGDGNIPLKITDNFKQEQSGELVCSKYLKKLDKEEIAREAIKYDGFLVTNDAIIFDLSCGYYEFKIKDLDCIIKKS